MRHLSRGICAAVFFATAGVAIAAETPLCPVCAEWNMPHAPFRIHSDTYYVGVEGLSAVLITSEEGHILIDGGSSESAALITANIATLGFSIEDVKLIVNSHAHFDHLGGIAELQRMSGATVAASTWSDGVMRAGESQLGDPQLDTVFPFDPISDVTEIEAGDTLTVGPIEITAHFTPGHTPGGTSWTWRSCEGETCADIVYADSLSAVSSDGFYFTPRADYPNAVADFERSFATLETIRCDILLSPHPVFTDLFEAEMRGGADAEPNAFLDEDACRNYAAAAREGFERRIARERAELAP
jgi:metallo-beta-lactamase class B